MCLRNNALALAVLAVGLVLVVDGAEVAFELTPGNLEQHLANGARIHRDVTTGGTGDEAYLHFGVDGVIQFPAPFPCHDGSPFTIEAVYELEKYPYYHIKIGSIIASFYWTGSATYGIDFRVGGGFVYPLLPDQAYQDQSGFVHPDGMLKAERAELSKTLAAFSMGGLEATNSWKEAYSEQSVPLGEWVHQVLVWDGAELRMYLDGHDATDGWRRVGESYTPRIDPTRDFWVGAHLEFAERHFDGKLRYVRVYDGVLSDDEIADHALEKYGKQCRNYLAITAPPAGAYVAGSTEIVLVQGALGNCSAGDWAKIDSFVVELSTDPAFSGEVIEIVVGRKSLHFSELLELASTPFGDGIVYVRIRPLDDAQLQKALAASDAAQGVSVPMYLIGTSDVLDGPELHPRGVLPKGRMDGRLVDPSGRAVRRHADMPSGVYLAPAADGRHTPVLVE